MSLAQPYRQRGDHFQSDGRPSYGRTSSMGMRAKAVPAVPAAAAAAAASYSQNYNNRPNSNFYQQNQGSSYEVSQYFRFSTDALPASKRRKFSNLPCESTQGLQQQRIPGENILENHTDVPQYVPPKFVSNYSDAPLVCRSTSVAPSTYKPDGDNASIAFKRVRSNYEDDEEVIFMSRDDIDRISPSRKDGIDVLHETHLRYSYCAFLQNLGTGLELPQTTIGTAMVLCHRFFLHRSHASHDRFMIATAVLFLTSKSEETPRPLNDVLRTSCEILHGQDFNVLSYMLPIGWFEQYRERITDAEHLILTTLNFELSVQHPYDSLTTTLQKLGVSQSVLVNLALSLVSEGLRSSLWLQFKPHQIAAGAAYLAAKFLNMNLASCHNVWHEFHTSPSVLRDVAHQLMELL